MTEIAVKIEGGVVKQQDVTILKGIDIEIKSGELVYFIGKVGSGKSSLLKTLYAELPLSYGTGTVAGFQLKKLKRSHVPELRRKCGIVFQDFKLLVDRDVYANLEFVLRATGWKDKKGIAERIETVLEKVEMTDKKFKMPHQLSGGEQQRIVLARALLNAPPIILADEPTGNIDPETSYQLVQLLHDLSEAGKTVIIATHQYDLIDKFPGRVFRFSDGGISEYRDAHCNETPSETINEEKLEESDSTPEIEEQAEA
ncbi:MAG: cell division ATP-binding protein FtsE [Marinifilaceae bacterium]